MSKKIADTVIMDLLTPKTQFKEDIWLVTVKIKTISGS